MKKDLDIALAFVGAAVGYAAFSWFLEGWLR
jgi:hypothetical protein